MKNKLAENMLRFGVKNLKESDIKKIEESVLNEQTSTLEAAFQDPRIKQSSDSSQQNQIIWQNLISYYSGGLLNKQAIGWAKNAQYGAQYNFQDQSQTLALTGVTGPVANFPIVEIYRGKNHILIKGGQIEEGDLDCIFICSEKMTVAGPNGNQGTMYPLSYDPNTKLTIDQYKLNGLPMKAHFRIIGTKVYYFPNVYGAYAPKNEIMTPIADKTILASLNA
jgi:hypothetical protein